MNIAYAFVLPAIGLLILFVGPAIRDKISRHGQKERGINPSNSLLSYAREDQFYRATVYSQAWGSPRPLGNIAKMIDKDE